MALKVRDEGDILEANLRFHHALGVDHFVVTDNGSTDETPEILRRYADAGLAHVINEPGTDYRERGADWLTRMARLAATDLEADWVIHTDADEFWWPARGHARGCAARDRRSGTAWWSRRAPSSWDDPTAPGSFAERLTVRESRARLQPKVAHRAEPDVVVLDRGGHDVAVAGPGGDVAETLRPPGRPVHRTVRDPNGSDAAPPRTRRQARLGAQLAAANPPLPGAVVRSSSSAVPRSRSSRAGSRTGGASGALREHLRGGPLGGALRRAGPGRRRASRTGSATAGWCATSASRACCRSAPIRSTAAPAGSVRVEPQPDELQREQAELEFDAMQLLGRTERWLIVQRDRARERDRRPRVAAREGRAAAGHRAAKGRAAPQQADEEARAPDRAASRAACGARPPVGQAAASGPAAAELVGRRRSDPLACSPCDWR